jgi:hypothetical protein
MGGWHLRTTWGQEVCYASLHREPASALGLPTVWSLWGNPGMARCREMSTLPAGYIPQCKVKSASSSGSLGFIVCEKCCRKVDSVPRWGLSLSWPIQLDHLLIADCDSTCYVHYNFSTPVFSCFMKWNWWPLSLKSCHFEASKDIMTKFKSQESILKSYWKWQSSLPHSHPPENCHFRS